MYNPLCQPIFDLLVEHKKYKIHSLYEALLERREIHSQDDCPTQDLFKKNFLIMNALFELEARSYSEGWHLIISSLHIELITKTSEALEVPNALRDYYLNWENFQTSKDDIDALLNLFWQKLHSNNSLNPNFNLDSLQPMWALTAPITLKQVQKRWRSLALQYHPDRFSGSRDLFQQLEMEYQQLKLFVAKTIN
ncbi:DnaJ-class molecular chaperone [Pseudoalteromonas luteoviolacea B = ATCC 29581]|nr:DnaJ-class molecular chaperone [Pseudoalteromonas luteoviolacea B = ATCC 29581]